MDISNITGTEVESFIHCQLECWFILNGILPDQCNESILIGKANHSGIREKNTEVKIFNSVVDAVDKDYVIEFKKSAADIRAAKMQLLFYLTLFKKAGLCKTGKLVVGKSKEPLLVYLTAENEKEIEDVCKEILTLSGTSMPPKVTKQKGCERCAYYYYCCAGTEGK